MIDKILHKLGITSNGSTINSILDEKCHAKCDTISNPKHPITLNVPEGQYAILHQQGQKTRFYHNGCHIPNNTEIAIGQPLDIIYIRHNGMCEGRLTYHYQDHEQAMLALLMEYALLIETPQRLAQECIIQQFVDERDFGQWLADSIAHILKSQRIPVSEIYAENDKFAVFLRDSLTLSLRPRGLSLKHLSLEIISPTATTNSAIEESNIENTEQQDNDADTTAVESEQLNHKTTHMIITREDQPKKIYYHVHNGQQLGPYSLNEIQQKIDEGILHKKDLIWQKGMPSWQNANTFPDFNWPEE